MAEEIADYEGIHEWRHQDEFPEHLKKYWFQRYSIWDKYNDGIWMTEDAWFEVTPEPIANKIAVHISEALPEKKKIIVDAFAGVGGNAIAFAREGRWSQVFAIEKNPKALACAKHNAAVYGVDKKITFISGDCFDVISKRLRGRDDVVIFASPPWGGTGYNETEVFDLQTMQPYNLHTMYTAFTKISKEVVMYLPRTSDLNQIAQYAKDDEKLDVAHYCIRGASKALCVYFGDFDFGVEE